MGRTPKDLRVSAAIAKSERMWGLAMALRGVMAEGKHPLIQHMARTIRETPGYPDPEWNIYRSVKAAAGYAKHPHPNLASHPDLDPLVAGQILAFNRLLEELERMADDAIKAWEEAP